MTLVLALENIFTVDYLLIEANVNIPQGNLETVL